MSADGEGRMAGRVAVVTGATRGIGRAIVEAYQREGGHVVAAARTEEDLAELTRSLGSSGTTVTADVTSDDDVVRLGDAAEAVGPVSVVVSSAGLYRPNRFLDYELDDFRRIMEVNFFGVVRVVRAFLPAMLDRRYGKVINIASTAGKYRSLFQSPYNSSKHAVVGLTRCLALETAKAGVTVNAICPGFVTTPMIDDALPRVADILGVDGPEQARAALVGRVPIGRFLEPEEVAHLAVYLGSAESDGMTGQALGIDGGLVLA